MVSNLNNLIMLFIQTGIKSSFMRQIWRLQKKYCLCHFGSYDKGISEIAKSYLRQCLHVQTITAVPACFQKYVCVSPNNCAQRQFEP